MARDLEGRPYSGKYHELPALLLSEVRGRQRIIDAQERLISEQRERIAALAARVERLEARRSPLGAHPDPFPTLAA